MSEGTKEFTMPDGMKLVQVPTATGGYKYSVEAIQATSLDALRKYYDSVDEDADAVLLDLWNKQNEQAAKQTAKDGVREAVQESDDPANDPAVVEAVEDHRADARTRIIGAPRKSGGPTKAQKEQIGSKVAQIATETGKSPTQAQIDEIMKEVLGNV